MLRALGGFDAERRVAARAAAARQLVFELFLDRQGEEPMEAIQAGIDEFPVDAVVLDDDEAVFGIGGGDVLGELRTLGIARVECGYFVGHGRAIVPTGFGM